MVRQGPKHLGHLPRLSQAISRELARLELGSRDSNQYDVPQCWPFKMRIFKENGLFVPRSKETSLEVYLQWMLWFHSPVGWVPTFSTGAAQENPLALPQGGHQDQNLEKIFQEFHIRKTLLAQFPTKRGKGEEIQGIHPHVHRKFLCPVLSRGVCRVQRAY